MNAALPPGELNCCGNICLSTFRVIGAAVEAPGEAPSSGNGFLLIDHHFGTELQHAALLCVFLDDLYALARSVSSLLYARPGSTLSAQRNGHHR